MDLNCFSKKGLSVFGNITQMNRLINEIIRMKHFYQHVIKICPSYKSLSSIKEIKNSGFLENETLRPLFSMYTLVQNVKSFCLTVENIIQLLDSHLLSCKLCLMNSAKQTVCSLCHNYAWEESRNVTVCDFCHSIRHKKCNDASSKQNLESSLNDCTCHSIKRESQPHSLRIK